MATQFRATAYRQATDPESPWLLSFVATAEDILSWAGIPRRAESGLVGFQRTEDPVRVAKAKEYFKQAQNQSPTALILGLHRPPGSAHLRVTFEDDQPDASVRHCTLEIVLDVASLSEAAVVDIVRAQVGSRLSESDIEESANQLSELDEPETEGEPTYTDDAMDSADSEEPVDSNAPISDDDTGTEEEIGSEGDEIELGSSILATLMQKLDDPSWVTANIEDLRDLAKPATVIDGQHRVLGAASCERNIPFTVVALLDCSWAEQVFQFTVVNYTAKGIADQFITANAALSLTSNELEELQTRLTQAGVKVVEYELMKVVNFDSQSPFFKLVNLTEKASAHLIGYKTMVRVAKGWYSARDPLFGMILPNLYPDLRGKSGAVKRARLNRWHEEDWGEFFRLFWTTVFDRYADKPSHEAGHTLWEVGHSQLLVAVVLQQLQSAFFSNLRVQDEEFFEVPGPSPAEARSQLSAKIARRAEKFLESIPPEFFSTKWEMTGLSIGPGRIALETAFTQLIETKGHYQYKRSTLVTGKAD